MDLLHLLELIALNLAMDSLSILKTNLETAIVSVQRSVRATITPIGRPVRATITLYPIGRPVRATITLYPIGRPV